jgi:farnesol dehydrogenase
MNILLTGGTGFLGRRLAGELAGPAGKYRLRLLVRPTASRERFPAGVEFAPGDVTDPASLEAAVAGCDAVIHAAALVKILAPREQFERVNVQGFENVLRAAGKRRLIYVSSFMALGPTENGAQGELDESAPAADRRWINDYERTKTLADRRARQAIAEGAPVTVLYPGVIYGAGELTEGNIVVRHVLDLIHRRLPALLGKPERRWNYVHVEDVVAGTIAALERETAGKRYVLGGENVTQGEFYRLIGELTGVKMPTLRMPDGAAKAAGALQKLWAQIRGSVPALTPDLVDVYRHDWAYRSASAEHDLGYRPRSLRAGMTETLDWLRQSGRI